MKLFDLSETELFHFYGIFKKKEMKPAKWNPYTPPFQKSLIRSWHRLQDQHVSLYDRLGITVLINTIELMYAHVKALYRVDVDYLACAGQSANNIIQELSINQELCFHTLSP